MTGTEMLKEIVKNLAFYGGTTMGGALWFLHGSLTVEYQEKYLQVL